jgi:hypothetical protein
LSENHVLRKIKRMKKIWITVAGSLFIALAANAQQRSDTTKTTTTTTTEHSTGYRNQPNQSESGTQSETSTIQGKSGTQGQQDQSYSWRDEDRMSVSKDELPAGLVQTLKSDQYQGWENATIYRNKTSDDYMLVLQDNGTTKTFYFDKEGKSKMNNSSMNGSSSSNGSSNMNGSSGTSGSGYSGSSSTGSGMNSSSSSDQSSGTSGSSTSGNSSSTSGSNYGTSGSGSGSSTYGNSSGSTSGSSTGTGTSGSTGTTGSNSTQSYGTSSGTTTPSGTSGSTLSTESSSQQPSNAWRTEDRVIVITDEIPSGLRATLNDDKYKGWENSTIYRNRKSNDYMIEIRDGSNAKVYYFDKDGQVISDTNNKE